MQKFSRQSSFIVYYDVFKAAHTVILLHQFYFLKLLSQSVVVYCYIAGSLVIQLKV